jgi:hypothetical protein
MCGFGLVTAALMLLIQRWHRRSRPPQTAPY